MPFTPRVERLPAPNPEEKARLQEIAEERRQQQKVEREQSEPARRAALATGPPLSDERAALDCFCSCHPRPAQLTLHEGGVSCSCQLTKEQRAAALDKLWASTAPLREVFEKEGNTLEEVADELGVQLFSFFPAAPTVISGVVDGRGFYFRERHDFFQVVVAPDDDPECDLWQAPPSTPKIIVLEGHVSSIAAPNGRGAGSIENFFRVTVNEVRLFLLRRECVHADAKRFCPVCGVEIQSLAQ